MESLTYGDMQRRKQRILADWLALPPAHRMSMLVLLVLNSPRGGWTEAAKDLILLTDKMKRASPIQAGEEAAGPEHAEVTRVLLVDGSPAFRSGLRAALAAADPALEVAETGTLMQVKALVLQLKPRIVVTDVHLHDRTGIELCRWLVDESPETTTLLVRDSYSCTCLGAALLAGAAGLVSKTADLADLVTAIRQAMEGPIFTRKELSRIQDYQRRIGDRLGKLSRDEWSVLRGVVLGKGNREIALDLFLSPSMVEKHVAELGAKLDVRRRAGLMALVRDHGIDLDVAQACCGFSTTKIEGNPQ